MCEKLSENLYCAIENYLASCYNFFSYEGPKYEKLSFPSIRFVGNYFYYPNEKFKHSNKINQLIENNLNYQSYIMAHNGWVMNVYLRRDLIQWSDIIKFRFGEKREDSPAVDAGSGGNQCFLKTFVVSIKKLKNKI